MSRYVDIDTKAIKERNSSIFAGAVLSIPVGFVNWKNFLRDNVTELNFDIDKENDLIAIVQYHYKERGNSRYQLNQHIIKEFT